MNYLRIYNNIIDKRKIEKPIGYKERHHIIPYCISKSNEESNLIDLTAREHYICHLLLIKIHKNDKYYYKLLNAFLMMNCKSKDQKRYYNSKLYEYLKIEFSNLMKYLNKNRIGNTKNHIWIKNINLRKCKLVKKEEVSQYLLKDWEIGNVINWESYLNYKKIKEYNKLKKQQEIHNKIKLYTEYYKIYDKYGWKKFQEITKYDKTKQCLVMRFAKYVKEFVPQNGKRRGKIDL